MGINKSRDSNFRKVTSSFRAGHYGISKAGKSLNYLNRVSPEEEEQEEEGVSQRSFDPTRFMNKKTAKAWEKLSESKKQYYKAQAEREVKRKGVPEGIAKHSTAETTEEVTAEQFRQDQEWIEETRDIKRQDEEKKKGKIAAGKEKGKIATGKNLSGGAGKGIKMTAAHETREGVKAGIAAAETSGAVTAAASATGGAGTAVQVSKKTADLFVDSLTMQKEYAEQGQLRYKLEQVKEENRGMGSLASAALFMGASMATSALSLVASVFQALVSVLATIMAIVFPTTAILVVAVSIFMSVIAPAEEDPPYTGTGIVEVALSEVGYHESGGTNNNGNITKYGQWIGMNGQSWCHTFVSWCANECGLIEKKVIPKTASCAVGRSWFIEKGQYRNASSGYKPKGGDIVYFDYEGRGVPGHSGIVEFTENGVVHTVEGNRSNEVQKGLYKLDSVAIMGYGTPKYPEESYGSGKTIKLPENLGSVYTYMGWNMVTNTSSAQYKLRIQSGEKYDEDGFGRIGERYVIACTTTYGKVGDEVDFVLKNGQVIHGVIGDIKNQDDAGCNKWGHQEGNCVVEFCVNKATWYGTNKTVDKFHPEWDNTTVVKAINLGKNHLK